MQFEFSILILLVVVPLFLWGPLRLAGWALIWLLLILLFTTLMGIH